MKGYDEPEILPSSTRPICLMRADGEHTALCRHMAGLAVSGLPAHEYVRTRHLAAEIGDIIERAGVSVPTTSTASALVQPLATAFVTSLAPISILDRLISEGAQQFAATSIMVTVESFIDAGDVAEGAPKPCAALTLDASQVSRYKTAAFVVISDALLKLSAPGSDQLFSTQLRNAITTATNRKIGAELFTLAGTPIAGTGNNVTADLTECRSAPIRDLCSFFIRMI